MIHEVDETLRGIAGLPLVCLYLWWRGEAGRVLQVLGEGAGRRGFRELGEGREEVGSGEVVFQNISEEGFTKHFASGAFGWLFRKEGMF